MQTSETKAAPTWSWSSFYAGAAAGAISATVVSPIEVVRAQMQRRHARGARRLTIPEIMGRIYTRQGFPGFYRGLPLSLMGILPGRGSYFFAYHTARNYLTEQFGAHPYVYMVAGAFGSAFSNTLTNPLWLIKSRMQIQAGDVAVCSRTYLGYGDAAVKIFREEGIGGFYKGLGASYWGATEAALHFMLYEEMKRRFGGADAEGHATAIQGAVYGGSAKLVASVTTYPHEVVRLRMREKPHIVGEPPEYTGMIQALAKIGREEGRVGLYGGLLPHLARTIPNSIILFACFEVFRNRLDELLEEKNADA